MNFIEYLSFFQSHVVCIIGGMLTSCTTVLLLCCSCQGIHIYPFSMNTTSIMSFIGYSCIILQFFDNDVAKCQIITFTVLLKQLDMIIKSLSASDSLQLVSIGDLRQTHEVRPHVNLTSYK